MKFNTGDTCFVLKFGHYRVGLVQITNTFRAYHYHTHSKSSESEPTYTYKTLVKFVKGDSKYFTLYSYLLESELELATLPELLTFYTQVVSCFSYVKV